MEPKYSIGQQVIVRPVANQPSSARDSDIGYLAGQTGTVTNYYSISPIAGQVFYIYTVQFEPGQKGIALHEDEIDTGITRGRRKSTPPI